jgi:hypothetical protein
VLTGHTALRPLSKLGIPDYPLGKNTINSHQMVENLKIASKDVIYRLSFIKQCLNFMLNFKSQGLKIAEVQCIRHHVYDFIDFLLV